MAQHAKVSLATSLPVYLADPHSPWQRPSTENMMCKGSGLV